MILWFPSAEWVNAGVTLGLEETQPQKSWRGIFSLKKLSELSGSDSSLRQAVLRGHLYTKVTLKHFKPNSPLRLI